MLARIRLLFLVLASFSLMVGTTPLLGQVHGVPASVTSFGFGGSTSSTPGIAASVTSLGPNGFGGEHGRFANCCSNIFFQGGSMRSSGGFRGHHLHRNFFAGGIPVYSVPYTQVIVVQPETDLVADDEEDDEGGPTIFDRRGTRASTRDSWRRRTVAMDAAPAPMAQPAATAAAPVPVVAQPSTLLVYRDGHQAELQNYAIVGDTIFDLTDNRARKIQLVDIDVAATRKANDARGVDFQVPGNPGQ